MGSVIPDPLEEAQQQLEELKAKQKKMGLTKEELEVIDLLAKAFTKFTKLPVMHPSERPEFVHHTHNLQHIVMARSAVRAHPDFFPVYPEKNTSK